MRTSDLLGDQVLVSQPVPTGWATAGTESTEPVFRAPHDLTVTAVYFLPGGDATAHATNFATLSVLNLGTDGAGTTSVAARATDTVTDDDQDDGVPWALTVSTTVADTEVDAGDVLAIDKTVAATGVAVAAGGVFVIHYRGGHAS